MKPTFTIFTVLLILNCLQSQSPIISPNYNGPSIDRWILINDSEKDGEIEDFNADSTVLETEENEFTIETTQLKSTIKIHFSKPVDNGRIQVFNSSEQLVSNHILGDGIDVFNMDISALKSGQYFIKYVHSAGIQTEVFVKE